ncbi:hypothetical protein PQQ20_06350 [Methanosarcina mazei]|uniref:hypothetical protein n=1 Tax=Methanosarcina mazei TaxID=2209 RepID=UPI002554AB0F|nr:hypothetical protein [Methanosarcina mazei]WIM44427.1 hypothetical protein PSF70_06375 [Methanosarcina mazei]WIM47884.1 hypothetical protein PQQ20_06350 [Methanosarcina mazei]
MGSELLKLNRTGLKLLFCLLITLSLFFGCLTHSANAEIVEWGVTPENPEKGDTIIISGLASPEEEVGVSISFEKTIPVYLGEYTYELENIEVLNFNNLLTIRTEGVESLKVKMKMVLSKTEATRAEDGTATVSFSGVSPGKYKIRVEGAAEEGASGVNLKVTSVQKLKAGKDGKFNYIYRTESVPPGKLEVRVGNSEREIILDAKEKTPEPVNVENEEKRSIYLAESSWDEDNSEAAIAGEVPSKGLEKEQKNQGHYNNQASNFFYLLAGALAGFGCLQVIKRKK